MKKQILFYTLIALTTFSLLNSCKKEEVRPSPVIEFLTGEAYTSEDVTIPAGDTVLVAMKCTWNGTDLLTAINILYNDNPAGTTNINPPIEEGTFTIKLTKNGANTEKFTFELVDANQQKSSISITLTKDATGNVPSIITNISLGAQNSTSHLSFYAFSNLTSYNLSDAANNQSIIDLIGAYDASNELHLTSPGANLSTIPEYSTIADWTVKNITYFCLMDITTEQYDLIDRDQYFVDAFNSFAVADQKRKAKSLKADDIYVFKTQSGKYGILKVKSVTTGVTGFVTFDVKMQP